MSLVSFRNRSLLPSIGSMFDNFFNDDFDVDQAVVRGTAMPAVNVRETENEFKLELAAPGKSKDDFNIQIENASISISSENETSDETNEESYTRKEYSFNSFKRSFRLPQNANSDEINAKYDNGILIVSIPKMEPSIQPKKL